MSFDRRRIAPPETLCDLKFSVAALSQEIATLRLSLEKGWPSSRRNETRVEIGRRLERLGRCRDELFRELQERERQVSGSF